MSVGGPISRPGPVRGHEPGRAGHPADAGRRHGAYSRPGGARDAEVDHPRPVRGQQHVRGLQVAVHHTRGVDGAQALGQPRRQGQRGARRHRPVAGHRLGQRGTGHVRRGQPRHRAVDVRVHHRGGEQAAHLPDGGDLAGEAHPEHGIGGQVRADHLDRDRSPPADRPRYTCPMPPRPAGRPAGTGRSAADPLVSNPRPRHTPPNVTKAPLTSSAQNNPKSAAERRNSGVGCFSDTS